VRIVSLLPSATEIVFALGLGGELVGVTHECDFPPGARNIRAVTTSVPDPSKASLHAIHRLVEGSAQAGSSIYALDEAALAEVRPDLILTQQLCRVCAVGYREASDVARRLEGEVTVMSLDPTSVEGVLNSIQAVGAMTEAEDQAVALVEELRERLRAVEEIVASRRQGGFAPPRVVAIEWLDPPFAVGRWVPEQVRRAGGWELLGHEGERSVETSWDAVREVDPEVMVLMPSGFGLEATVRAWDALPHPTGWGDLHAVQERRVHAVDASAYFSRPGPRVVDGIELLAEVIDPLAFDGMAPPRSWATVG
jgi:iron complex transport system substrate-binding protein